MDGSGNTSGDARGLKGGAAEDVDERDSRDDVDEDAELVSAGRSRLAIFAVVDFVLPTGRRVLGRAGSSR